MDNKMTGTVDIRVRVEGDMKDPKTLSSMRKLQKSMESDEKVLTSFSIANVVEQMHRTVMDDDPSFEVIPEEREKVNNLFTMYSMSGDPDDFSTLIDYEYEVGLITAFSKVMTTKEIFAYVNEMNNQVKAIMNPNLSVDFTGMIVILRDLVIMVVRSSALSIIFSLIIYFLFCFISPLQAALKDQIISNLKKTENYKPDIIFSSAISSHIHGEGEYINIQYTYNLLKDIKFNGILIFGGLQPTANPKKIFDNGGQVFFAVENQTTIGTVAMIKSSEHMFELAKMTVDIQYRGNGIANALMDKCILFAKEKEAKEIILITNDTLVIARNLYDKYGFKEVELDSDKYLRGNVKMTLNLTEE